MNIKRLRRRLESKLKNSRGASLGEVLTATLILLFVSMAMATGVMFAADHFTKSMIRSESKVLYSTLENVIENELANTNTVVLGPRNPDGSYVVNKFFSQNYAAHDSLSSFVVYPEGQPYGELALGSELETNKLLSSSAYTYGLGASVNVSYHTSPERFRVLLSIYNGTGDRIISEPFDVVPLNAIKIDDDG